MRLKAATCWLLWMAITVRFGAAGRSVVFVVSLAIMIPASLIVRLAMLIRGDQHSTQKNHEPTSFRAAMFLYWQYSARASIPD